MKTAFRKKILSMAMAMALILIGIPTAALAAEPPEPPDTLQFDKTNVIKVERERIISDNFDSASNGDDEWDADVYYVPAGTTITLTQNPEFTGEIFYVTLTDLDKYAKGDADYSYDFYSFDVGINEGSPPNLMPDVKIKFDAVSNESATINFAQPNHLYTLTVSRTWIVDDFTFFGEHIHVAYFRVVDSGAPTQTEQPSADITAKPTSSKVLVNGKDVSLDAYNINSNNYCKIRDVAQILNGTGKQFEVVWDKDLQAVNMTSNQTYTPVGGELAKGDGSNKNATLNTAKIYLDGKAVSLTAYTINGNNYIKLRDLGQTFDFGVSWDKTLNAVVIDTSTGYTAE